MSQQEELGAWSEQAYKKAIEAVDNHIVFLERIKSSVETALVEARSLKGNLISMHSEMLHEKQHPYMMMVDRETARETLRHLVGYDEFVEKEK